LEFDRVAKISNLWETLFMSKKLKVGDAVFYGDPPRSFTVEDVDYAVETADIRKTSGVISVHQNIAWAELTLLDESQNADRIVREATE
jgi:hypothetical protein